MVTWDIPIIAKQPEKLKLDDPTIWTNAGSSANVIEQSFSKSISISQFSAGSYITGSATETLDLTARDSPQSWKGVACSHSGNMALAGIANGSRFVSSDSGSTWALKGSAGNGLLTAISPDGKFMMQATSELPVYVSANAGSDWTSYVGNADWRGVAVSDGGSLMVSCQFNGFLYFSTDCGSNITRRDLTATPGTTAYNWNGIAMSSTGSKLVACCNTGSVYYSWTCGSTWYASNLPSSSYQHISLSRDGKYAVVVRDVGSLYYSTDSGSIYTGLITGSWSSSAVTGSKIVACSTGSLLTSSDAGSTWTSRLSDTWNGATISNNGSVLMVVSNAPGSIFVSTNWNYPYNVWGDWTSGGATNTSLSENWNALRSNWDLIGWVNANQAGSLIVDIASDTTFTNYNRYVKTIGSGWNMVSIGLGSPTSSGGTLDWTNVKSVRFDSTGSPTLIQDWALGTVANSG